MPKSAAKTLGRKGGKSTAQKRTKEQRVEASRIAANKRWAEVRREREPDVFIFERVLGDKWFSSSTDPRDRSSYYSDHRVKPLLDAGYVVPDRQEAQSHGSVYLYYRHTGSGLRWWFSERIQDYKRHADGCAHLREGGEFAYKFSPSSLSEDMQGKGISAHAQFGGAWNGPAVFTALRDGLFSFVSHTDYSGMYHGPSEFITVELTPAGFAYFNSLPKLIEVWE